MPDSAASSRSTGTRGLKAHTYTNRLHPYGQPANCGFGHFVDSRRDQVHIIVPSRCRQAPEWVRVQTDAVVWMGDPRETIARDEGLDDGYRWDRKQQWSPRIHATG